MMNHKLSWKRGIKRISFVISVIAFSLGIYILGFYMARNHPVILDSFIEWGITACIIFGLAWVIYDIVHWIIYGLRDNEKKEADSRLQK